MRPKRKRVFAGPERGTQQTAQALGLAAVVAVELRDCDYAAWGGREFEELQQDQPEWVVAWLTDPVAVPHGGESIVNLLDRLGRWMDEQGKDGHMVAVTHPAVVRCAGAFTR